MTLTRCDSLGYLAVTVDSRAVGGVDLHVVVDTGVHGGGWCIAMPWTRSGRADSRSAATSGSH
jgi:hypothetical protein